MRAIGHVQPSIKEMKAAQEAFIKKDEDEVNKVFDGGLGEAEDAELEPLNENFDPANFFGDFDKLPINEGVRDLEDEVAKHEN
jgi:hypothetical protein